MVTPDHHPVSTLARGKWNDNANVEFIKPKGYFPGMGTGFLPGETLPGVI